MANSDNPTLESLAAQITELSGQLPTSYSNLTGEMFMVRQKLLDSLNDMWWLAQGPSESIFNYCHSAIPDATVLNTLNSFGFWGAVPLTGSTTYADIAHEVQLPQAVVYRLLQHAMTLRIFAEEAGKDGNAPRVRHTSRSAALARQPGLRALVSTVLDDAGAPLMVLPEALRRFSSGKTDLTQKTDETAFALFHQGGQFGGKFETSWDYIENDGEGEKKGWRQRNFVQFMSYLKDIFLLEDKVLAAYDWASAGKASVVDIGGSAGHDAFALAQKFPDLTITVQDLPQVRSSFEASRPAAVADRVSFSAHSFFEPQPVQADIYLIKLILHDWPDAECLKILRGLIPALRPGAKVIILEYLGNYGTATDVRVMALFNAKERSVSKWKSLVAEVDPRFKIEKVEAKPEAFFALIEAVWTG
ncbi:uncharacterized protein PG986_013081 [Apiospora aurea]|uniref:O-methyltransferase C-terminal domain-containing protein n=1 Tax=Apiospora aurea TaxID=335848 RepID=A0ABR1Q1T2_9PEZI